MSLRTDAPRVIPDYMSKAGAERLANSIRRYWAGKRSSGLPNIWIGQESSRASADHGQSSNIYVVRSDMINAVPKP